MREPENLRVVLNLLEGIVKKSGDEKENVYLDIILHMIFSGRNLIQQQMVINQISALYEMNQLYLKKNGVTMTEEDLPF